MKIRALILSIVVMINMTACGVNTSKQPESTLRTNIQYNEESISTSINKVISTGELDSNFVDGFAFNANDTVGINSNSKTYLFDGAYYIQTETYMYRFQLNEAGLIESYIKYNLIG